VSTLGEQLATAKRRLAVEPAGALEAEVLLAHCLGRSRAYLYTHPDAVLDQEPAARFGALVERRLHGEPLAYLTGMREFWSLTLEVGPQVLIPRPETERLVELALERIPLGAASRVADLGTGSGAIAMALASERPDCEVHASDLSAEALAVARRNAHRLGLERVALHLGSWCEPLPGLFDVIVSNPPYVTADDPHLHRGDCRFEPRQALTPGPDGLAAIRAIAGQARARLSPGGWLLMEHGPDQGAAVRELLQALGYTGIVSHRDLLGHERVTGGRFTP